MTQREYLERFLNNNVSHKGRNDLTRTAPPRNHLSNTDRNNIVRVGCLNVGGANFGRGIGTKEATLIDIAHRNQLDVFYIVEADLENYEPYKIINLAGYDQYAANKTKVRGNDGRLTEKVRCVGFVKHGTFETVQQLKNEGTEQEVWLQTVTTEGEKRVIGGVYREWRHPDEMREKPGSTKLKHTLGLISRLEKRATENTFLIGDFNLCTQRARKIGSADHKDLMEITQAGYAVKDCGFTFVKRTTKGVSESALDYMLTSADYEGELQKKLVGASDHHRLIYFDLKSGKVRGDKYRWTRNRKQLETAEAKGRLETKMEEYIARETGAEKDVDKLSEAINKAMTDHLNETCPKYKIKIKPGERYAETKEMKGLYKALEATSTREEILRGKILCQPGKNIHRKRLKNCIEKQTRLTRQLTKAHNKEQRVHEEKQLAKHGHDGVWKRHKRWSKESRSNMRIREGDRTLTGKEAANGYGAHFVGKIKRLRSEMEVDMRGVVETGGEGSGEWEALERHRYGNVCIPGERTVQEVENRINTLNPSGAEDVDEITQTDFKRMLNANTRKQIANLVNKSLEMGKFPSNFKTARLTCMPKSGKDVSKYEGYRPLSNLKSAGKVIEGEIKEIMVDWANKMEVMPETQHGYRKGRSVKTAIAAAEKVIDIGKRKGRKMGAVLFDFSAAFDLVDRDLLLVKLKKAGFGNRILRWVNSYLENRKIIVEIEGERSKLFSLEVGTPQGSIISPLLFVFMISDIADEMKGSIICYADDTSCILEGKTIDELRAKMKEAIKNMLRYSRSNKLALNVEKTEIIHFGTKPLGEIEVEGMTLTEKEEVKFLGVWLTKKQSKLIHIGKQEQKAAVESAYMHRSGNFFPQGTRIQIAKACIIPRITSQIETWTDPFTRKGMKNIDRLQIAFNNVARSTLRIKREEHTSAAELMRKLGERTAEEMSIYRHASLAWDLHHAETTLGGQGDYPEDFGKDGEIKRDSRQLPVYEAATGTIDRTRRFWNLLTKMGKGHLKECSDRSPIWNNELGEYPIIANKNRYMREIDLLMGELKEKIKQIRINRTH